MIEVSRYRIEQKLSEVGTTEVKPTSALPWKFGKKATFDGHEAIDTERVFLGNDGAKLRVTGSHGIAGTGKLTINLYSGKGDTADTLIAAYGPYDASAIGGIETLAFPPGSYAGRVFQVGLVASAAAGTAFTAGTITITPEFE